MIKEKKFDLHIHSRHSNDGVLSPYEIVNVARKNGLSGIAITDHNTIKGGAEAKEFETKDFKVIIGAEITTNMGEIIGLFLTREIKSKLMLDVINEIKDQNGLVIVPHPFDRLRHSSFPISEEYVSLVDAIEGFNSRCILQRYNKKAFNFALKYKLPVVGGSDAHYANEIGLSGIIIVSDDVKQAIIHSELRLFGKHSSLLNHAKTKIRKWIKQTK